MTMPPDPSDIPTVAPSSGPGPGAVSGASSRPTDSLPAAIGPYAIRGVLGRGGMGVVYAALDARLNREIAVKTLPSELEGRTAGTAGRDLIAEARRLAALNHPNIATIYSLEQDGALHFLTMERVPGATLSERISRGALALDEALDVARQIAQALEAAHDRGIIHCDLKPQNVKVTPGGLVKVLDFGLARMFRDQGPAIADAPGAFAGTPGYMSPEQLRGEALDARSDVWAFGCTFFECLTAAAAFPGADVWSRMEATLERGPDFSLLPAGTPARITAALRVCLRADPGDRPASIGIVRRAIDDEISRRAFDAASRAAMAPSVSGPHNLPLVVSRFIGRTRDLARLTGLLESRRLVTLTGAGGCGKTRLALEVARSLAGGPFPDGIWFVELAPLVHREKILPAVGAAFGLKEEQGRPLDRQLPTLLERKRALIILDNCEHLIEGAAGVAGALLAECTGVAILATSRESLGVDGEHVYPVTPLPVPPAGRVIALEDLADTDAVAFFIDRAMAAEPSFSLTIENAPAVAEICRKLDGIPLALELAAARIRTLDVGTIAARIDDRFRLLQPARRGRPEKHRTLEGLIDWSHRLLTPSEQVLFRRLAIFAGGWTLEAAEAVCAGEGIEGWEILDLLSRLIEKSLVERHVRSTGSTPVERPRYRMLETIRQYARGRLDEEGEADVLRGAHARFYLALAEDADSRFRGAEEGRWLDILEDDNENLEAALLALEAQEADPEPGLRMVGVLGRYWDIRGRWVEGRRIATRMLARRGPRARTVARARALSTAGLLALNQSDSAQARSWLEESAAISRECGDRNGTAYALCSLAIVIRQDDPERAGALREESLAIFRETGNHSGVALALLRIGNAAYWKNDLARARAFYDESLELYGRIGDRAGSARVLTNLGNVLERQGDPAGARRCYDEALRTFGEMNDRRNTAALLGNLARLAELEQDWPTARSLQEEALVIFRELNDRQAIAWTLLGLGLAASAQQDFESALALTGDSLRISREIDDRHGIVEAVEALAYIAVDSGDPLRATRLMSAADAFREQSELIRNPAAQSEVDAACARWRGMLGSDVFERERASARAAGLEAVVDERRSRRPA